MKDDTGIWEVAEKTARGKLGFQVHLAAYIVGSLFLMMIWFVSGSYNIYAFPWFLIPVAGWGIGVVAHFVLAYRGGAHLQTMAEKEYRRMKTKS